MPRHSTSLLLSWHETWNKAEDWLPVPKSQEDVLWRRLGAGFHAHYGYPLKIVVDVDEIASSHGASGSMQMERVNTWLASLESASIPPLDTIEFINSYGRVDKMFRLPPKQGDTPRKVYRKSVVPSPSLPPKCLQQSSSKFPIRDRKGKGKAKSFSDEDKAFKKLVNDTMDQILGALKIKDTTPKLDDIIERALLGDNWFEKPRFANNNWPLGLTPHKPMPLSSQIKKLGKPEPIYADKLRDAFKATASKEARIAARETKLQGDSFIVRIQKYRNVNHSPENPVWKIPEFCYLEVMNLALDRNPFGLPIQQCILLHNLGKSIEK